MNVYYVYFVLIAVISALLGHFGDEAGANWVLLLGIFMFISIIAQEEYGDDTE